MTRRPSEPALRVPSSGSRAGSGGWERVSWTPEGVPILVADGDAYLDEVGDAVRAPFEALPFESQRHLAHYLPRVAQEDALGSAVREALERHVPPAAELGVEAGCSVGADLPALRAACARVVAFDANAAAVRVAAVLAGGQPVDVPIREEGHRFRWGTRVQRPPLSDVTLVIGDALDPPLQAGCADVVLCLNLLDNVAEPLNLLGQLDAILAPGGLLVLSSPFAWHDALTALPHQLGGGSAAPFAGRDSADVLRGLLTGTEPVLKHLDYTILETHEVPWVLRDHTRAAFHYEVHLLVARKASAHEPTPTSI